MFCFRASAEEAGVCCKITGGAEELGSLMKQHHVSAHLTETRIFSLVSQGSGAQGTAWAVQPKLLSVPVCFVKLSALLGRWI